MDKKHKLSKEKNNNKEDKNYIIYHIPFKKKIISLKNIEKYILYLVYLKRIFQT